MTEPGSKHFLAIIPPEPVFSEAMKWKEYFRDHHNTKGALRSPAHITLHMPFFWPDRKKEVLLEKLKKFADEQMSFEIQLKDFGCFKPRVIFIGVDSSDYLNQLQKKSDHFFKTELNVFSANYRDLPFHPHLTVAFRDLKKSEFANAWASVEKIKFEASFTASSITLLRHDGKKWTAWKNFELGKT